MQHIRTDLIRALITELRQTPEGYVADDPRFRNALHAAALNADAAAGSDPDSDDARAARRAAEVACHLLNEPNAGAREVSELTAGLEAGLRLAAISTDIPFEGPWDARTAS